jgi:hypothetical protein
VVRRKSAAQVFQVKGGERKMKKLSIIAITLMIGTSVVFASTIAVPWFVDNGPTASGSPAATDGTMTLITLKNTMGTTAECTITYYNAGGDELGPAALDGANTFSIAPLSSLAFRPVKFDPGNSVPVVGVPGGQEGTQGRLVPDRPMDYVLEEAVEGEGGSDVVIDTKKNGSATIYWDGPASQVQGQVAFQQIGTPSGGTGARVMQAWGHLLPAGV